LFKRSLCSGRTNSSTALLIMTVILDDCNGQSAASRDTAGFSVSGDQLTLISGVDSTVLKKGTPSPVYLTGSWTVDQVNDQATDRDITLNFDPNTFTVTRQPQADQTVTACSATASYERARHGVVSFTVLNDDCAFSPVGSSTQAIYLVTSTTLLTNWEFLLQARRQ